MKNVNTWNWQNKKFPKLAVLLFVVGILWLLTDLGIITVKIPWWPIILIVISFGWIVDNYKR